jgi:hypothetical protein
LQVVLAQSLAGRRLLVGVEYPPGLGNWSRFRQLILAQCGLQQWLRVLHRLFIQLVHGRFAFTISAAGRGWYAATAVGRQGHSFFAILAAPCGSAASRYSMQRLHYSVDVREFLKITLLTD